MPRSPPSKDRLEDQVRDTAETPLSAHTQRAHSRTNDTAQGSLSIPIAAECRRDQRSRATARAWSCPSRSCCAAPGRSPPHQEMIIDDLTEEEGAAVLTALEA